jgi:hypothetical protein
MPPHVPGSGGGTCRAGARGGGGLPSLLPSHGSVHAVASPAWAKTAVRWQILHACPSRWALLLAGCNARVGVGRTVARGRRNAMKQTPTGGLTLLPDRTSLQGTRNVGQSHSKTGSIRPSRHRRWPAGQLDLGGVANGAGRRHGSNWHMWRATTLGAHPASPRDRKASRATPRAASADGPTRVPPAVSEPLAGTLTVFHGQQHRQSLARAAQIVLAPAVSLWSVAGSPPLQLSS